MYDRQITSKEEMEFAAWYNTEQKKLININREFAENERELERRMFEGINEKILKKILPSQVGC